MPNAPQMHYQESCASKATMDMEYVNSKISFERIIFVWHVWVKDKFFVAFLLEKWGSKWGRGWVAGNIRDH